MTDHMESIRRLEVKAGRLAIWWLGQNGFILRSPSGVTLSVDAYLTNSCQRLHGESLGIDLNRKVPVFIEPEQLAVDYFLCTHSHDDHADPETISRLRRENMKALAGPGLTCEKFRRLGVEESKIHRLFAGCKFRAGDVTIRGTFALPTDDTDMDHMGFFISVDQGPKVYLTGDTDYSRLLEHVGKLAPDVMISCINGGFNNLSHWEAAEVARAVRPKIAIPCHYDMFPDNAVDPLQFRASLRIRAPEVQYRQLEHMVPFLVGDGS